MLFSMETGILCHPTSLPGPWGIGTLGSEAVDFADWLASSGASVWQILPLSPPVCSASPYQALSSFALNPLLLSPEKLAKSGLLTKNELGEAKIKPGREIGWKALNTRNALLEKAAGRSLADPPAPFRKFRNRRWVKEWSSYAAKKEMNLGKPWHLWKNLAPPPAERVMIHAMLQYLLEEQWFLLKDYCKDLGIRIMGDLPIYAAHDSADVFYNRKIFKLQPSGEPASLAGVPPDYFSETGQLWGNPVYRWRESEATGHRWWTCRFRRSMELFDAVRIDHFRGFESYWEVPAGSETAEEGKWVMGPGYPFFEKVRMTLGELPLIAEDLGIITDSVRHLRKKCGFPGMTVLQFALQDPSFRTSSIKRDTIVYTGTHDNDTTAGWIVSTGEAIGYHSPEAIVELALGSPAELAVIPVQDVLGLGSSARMNTPAKAEGNWSFRLLSVPPPADLRRKSLPVSSRGT